MGAGASSPRRRRRRRTVGPDGAGATPEAAPLQLAPGQLSLAGWRGGVREARAASGQPACLASHAGEGGLLRLERRRRRGRRCCWAFLKAEGTSSSPGGGGGGVPPPRVGSGVAPAARPPAPGPARRGPAPPWRRAPATRRPAAGSGSARRSRRAPPRPPRAASAAPRPAADGSPAAERCAIDPSICGSKDGPEDQRAGEQGGGGGRPLQRRAGDCVPPRPQPPGDGQPGAGPPHHPLGGRGPEGPDPQGGGEGLRPGKEKRRPQAPVHLVRIATHNIIHGSPPLGGGARLTHSIII